MLRFYTYLNICFLAYLLSSCSIITALFEAKFYKGSYRYTYAGGRKRVDFREGNWLIASDDTNHVAFFNKYLGNRLKQLNKVQTKEGKLAYVFDVNPNLSDKELLQIREITQYDYLITLSNSSKTIDRKWSKLDYIDKKQRSVLNVYKLSSGFLEYQIICDGFSATDDDRFYEIDTDSKLFNKIDKHAKY